MSTGMKVVLLFVGVIVLSKILGLDTSTPSIGAQPAQPNAAERAYRDAYQRGYDRVMQAAPSVSSCRTVYDRNPEKQRSTWSTECK